MRRRHSPPRPNEIEPWPPIEQYDAGRPLSRCPAVGPVDADRVVPSHAGSVGVSAYGKVVRTAPSATWTVATPERSSIAGTCRTTEGSFVAAAPVPIVSVPTGGAVSPATAVVAPGRPVRRAHASSAARRERCARRRSCVVNRSPLPACSGALSLFADDRPEEAHHDEEAGEHRDQGEAAVRRAGTGVGHELQPDPKTSAQPMNRTVNSVFVLGALNQHQGRPALGGRRRAQESATIRALTPIATTKLTDSILLNGAKGCKRRASITDRWAGPWTDVSARMLTNRRPSSSPRDARPSVDDHGPEAVPVCRRDGIGAVRSLPTSHRPPRWYRGWQAFWPGQARSLSVGFPADEPESEWERQ